jgi:hypothetical protein
MNILRHSRQHAGFLGVALLLVACDATAARDSTLAQATAVADSAPRAGTVRCWVSDSSVLARAPGTVAPGPAGLRGWIVLDPPSVGQSGTARLVDSDGADLDATWNGLGGDSVAVVGFDDFLRVEMRLAVTVDEVAGVAHAGSDAAQERDSAGKMRDFQRSWRVAARAASCDSLPPPGAAPSGDSVPR